MGHKRVTMQDIADGCGLSRNTVSKVFNGKGAVPEATRRMVLQKAKDLGYHQLPVELLGDDAPASPRSRNVALLTRKMPRDYHFATFFLPVFTEQLSRAGYTLTLHEISGEELRQCRLPSHLALDEVAGILGLELFDKAYLDMLCALRLPTIFIDAFAGVTMYPMECDFIFMENQASVAALTAHMIEGGAKRLGFVGDMNHCNSFRERWIGFCHALERACLPVDRRLCILAEDFSPYYSPQWLMDQVRAMPQRPDALFCANDYIALRMLTALKHMGLTVPGDVMLAGFDGMPQTEVVEPALTTAQIPNAAIGRAAADVLLRRIETPDRPFCTIYMKTTTLLRDSTRNPQPGAGNGR